MSKPIRIASLLVAMVAFVLVIARMPMHNDIDVSAIINEDDPLLTTGKISKTLKTAPHNNSGAESLKRMPQPALAPLPTGEARNPIDEATDRNASTRKTNQETNRTYQDSYYVEIPYEEHTENRIFTSYGSYDEEAQIEADLFFAETLDEFADKKGEEE